MTGPPAETRGEALTRSRIEHWLRNRNLMFYDVSDHGIGFGPTVDAITVLMDDLAEYAAAPPGPGAVPAETPGQQEAQASLGKLSAELGRGD